jgi:hypothetical protein
MNDEDGWKEIGIQYLRKQHFSLEFFLKFTGTYMDWIWIINFNENGISKKVDNFGPFKMFLKKGRGKF